EHVQIRELSDLIRRQHELLQVRYRVGERRLYARDAVATRRCQLMLAFRLALDCYLVRSSVMG
ncbi:hypothetical protein, partial [Salmonella enterica]|uniref:hypothetical protein n=1 Tax=Salmonella enterica TaxID=28901 RepID=UPI0020C4264F